MAVSAKFIADFTSFTAAVDKAETKLRSFESGASSVEKALTRMGDNFSGRKILQEATLAAKAVEDIGGVSKLTSAEQKKLNTIVTEALAKYKALGQEAPPNLIAIEKATRGAAESTSGLSVKMIAIGTAIGTFVGKLAVDAVKALGREVLELATNGIKLAPIVSSFERLTASIGESGDAMLSVTRTATKGLVKDLDIMQAANKAILLGLPVTAQEFGTLAKAATTLGRAMGQDATKSLDDLIVALGRSSPMILDNLGLTVKVGEANEKYAAQVGKSSSQLTDAEKKLAFYNAALDAAKVKTDALGEVQLTLADQLARVKIGFTNFTDALGVAIARSPVLNELLGGVADAIGEAFGENQVARVQALIKVVNESAIAFVDMGLVAIDVADGISRAYHVVSDTVRLDMGNLARAVIGQFRETIDVLLAATAAVRRFDPTGTVDKNFKLLLAMRIAMEGAGRETSGFQSTLDSASKSLSALRERMLEASKTQADAAGIADDLTRRLRDQDGALKGTTKATTDLAKAQDELFGRDIITKANATVKALGDIGNVSLLSAEKQRELNKQVREALDVYRRLGQTAPEALTQLERATFSAHARTGDLHLVMSAIPPAATDMAHAAQIATNRLRGFTDEGVIPSGRALAITLEQIYAIPPALTSMDVSVNKSKGVLSSLMTTLKQSLGGLNDIFQRAFEGGGGVAGAIQSFATNVVSNLLETIPVVGKFISQFAGAIVSGFKKLGQVLFGGPSEQELEGRKVAENFRKGIEAGLSAAQRAEAAGIDRILQDNERWKLSVIGIRDAYIATGRTQDEAGAAVQRLWAAEKRGAEAVQRVMEEIQGVFDEQRADVERLNSAIQRYGFTIDELGPTFRNQRLNEQAKELIEDWRVLVASGINLTVVNARMADSINEYLQTAIRVGAEVPAAMKPILQSLVDQGKLFDANGNQISDLESAGVTFAETMTQGFDRVVAKLQILIDRLNDTGHSLENLPKNIEIGIGFKVQDLESAIAERGVFGVFGAAERFHKGGVVDFAKWKRAHSGLAVDEVPIIAQAGEVILSRQRVAQLGGAANALSGDVGQQKVPITLVMELDGRVIGRVAAEYLPGALATMGVKVA